MRWLFSRPLAVQLVVVVVGAIVFSLTVSFYLFFNERRVALRDAGIYQAVFRTVAIARTLQVTDMMVHRQIIRVSSSRRWRYWVSDTAAVTAPQALPRRVRLTRALTERYPYLTQGLLFQRGAGLMPPPRRGLPSSNRPSGPREGVFRADPNHAPPRQPVLTVSVPLSDGVWLNGMAFQLPTNPPLGWQPLMSLGILVVSIVGLLLLLIRRVTRPLSALATAADRLGRGERLGTVPEHGPREVRVTTRAFNSMQQRISRFVEDRTRMLAAISHDLRTPVTALRLRAEMLEEGENRDRMLETLDTMAAMTDATLSFIRDESVSEETSRVDLGALVGSLCEDFRDMGKDVTWNRPERLIYPCRPSGLRRVLMNLIENALTYGRKATVTIECDEADILVRIADDGPGIAEEKLDSVFKPFERLDDARNTENGHMGLGLSIARSIVQSHGGDVTLSNRPEGGLDAKVRLPMVKS